MEWWELSGPVFVVCLFVSGDWTSSTSSTSDTASGGGGVLDSMPAVHVEMLSITITRSTD